tara:strand:+ start:1467 stop:1676 length:210 start_codon:yes stop_codon:yes gene_type:complete
LGIGGGIEGVNDLGVGDEDFFDDEVGTKLFDEVFFGVNGVFGLLLEGEASLLRIRGRVSVLFELRSRPR